MLRARTGSRSPDARLARRSCGRRPDQNRLIGHFDVECVAVGLGIDGHGLYSHAASSLDDPAGDLAAVGDQNSFEHFLDCSLWAGSGATNWHSGDGRNNSVVQQNQTEATAYMPKIHLSG